MATILVGIADLRVSKNPDIISTLGLGSCVGVTLFDPQLKLGGLVHILLPVGNGDAAANKAKYADSGIPELIRQLLVMGASRQRLQAKIAGGANMFAGSQKQNVFQIGLRNAETCRAVLQQEQVRLVAEDTGGTYGRTISLNTENGKLHIKTVGHGERDI